MTKAKVRFDGRAILVTGAGRGLGRTHAMLVASRGASVVIADNGAALDGTDASSGPAASVVAEIVAAGGKAVACTADIATESGSAQAIDTCISAFGRIDGILHNASTSPNLTTTDQLSSHDFDAVMRVNVYAAAWMTRAAWPHMVTQNYGRIVYTTSAGVYGSFGNAHYAAAKAAIIGLMRCFAVEGEKHGIIVNAIAPGARTRMTERFHSSAYTDWFLKTMAPEKVSAAAAYLLSEDCRIHGEIFAMGGGRIARMTLAESDGIMTSGTSIEETRDAIPAVMADTHFFHPKDLSERSVRQAELFGFEGGLGSSSAFAVKPIEKG